MSPLHVHVVGVFSAAKDLPVPVVMDAATPIETALALVTLEAVAAAVVLVEVEVGVEEVLAWAAEASVALLGGGDLVQGPGPHSRLTWRLFPAL